MSDLAKEMESHRTRVAEARAKWPRGPWDQEPDRVEFEHQGLPCILLRQPSSGHWCGYVGVPPEHPAFGKAPRYYDDEGKELPPNPTNDLDVHGGITYTEHCAGAVCHVPKPGEDDRRWWLGFDCAHAYDLTPRGAADELRCCGEVYRDARYVEMECRSLAEQLAKL